MRTRGYELRIFSGCTSATATWPAAIKYACATHAAFADPDIDAIFCLRGGYGTPRLLDGVDFALLAANPKPFVGYSDIIRAPWRSAATPVL